MELTATNVLSLFQTTKEDRQSFVNSMVLAMKEGHADPIQVHTQIKCLEHLIEEMKDNEEYKSMLLDESAKHGKSFTRYNADFTVREVGVKYDYSVCQDEVMKELQYEKEVIDGKIKMRQKLLQTIPGSGMVDPSNGNLIYPPVKTSTTSVIVKLK